MRWPRRSDDGDQRRRWSAPLRPRNYRAVVGAFRTYARPVDGLRRYVSGAGEWPVDVALRTPTGRLVLRLPHPHDMRTVNEVFARRDYGDGAPRVVVDVGGNIGVSAAWFLTRRHDSVVHVWEPVPSNLTSLRRNLAPFGDRYVLHEAALAPQAGEAEFLVESVGRYSGLADYLDDHGQYAHLRVRCDAIGAALREVIDAEGRVDLLKIDTEGSEEALIAAIPDDVWPHLGEVVYETPDGVRTRRSRP